MNSRAIFNTKLSLDDLKACRKELSNSIAVTRQKAFEALESRRIDSSKFQEAKDDWQQLQIQESQLAGLIASLEISFLLDTNIDSPRSKIIRSTDKLKAAAISTENFQGFLGAIADVIEIFAGVIKAIRGGQIANISSAALSI